MTENDRLKFLWEKSKSKENITQIISKIDSSKLNNLQDLSEIKEYEKDITSLFNEGESKQNIDSYKQSVLGLLRMKSK